MQMEWQTLWTLIRLLLGAVWSGSIQFAQAYLSENLGSLRYSDTRKIVVIILKLEQYGSTVE